MHSTMFAMPLTIARILRHGSTIHGSSTVGTWNGDGFDRLTYAEVGERAARLAHALRTRLGVDVGTRPQDRQGVVGTFMWNNARHLELCLAVPAMGAVAHPVNLRMTDAQIAYTVRHSGDEVLVVDAVLIDVLAPVLPLLPSTLRHIVVAGPGDRGPLAGFAGEVHDYEELIADSPSDYPWEEELDEHTAAVICYTSGTTGHPKGIVYSHRSIYLHCLQGAAPNRYDLTLRETAFPIGPMFHVNGWGIPHAAFATGADLLLTDRHSKPASLARIIEAGRPGVAAAVPTVWTGLLDELDARPRDTSSLRRGLVGGSACPPGLIAAYRERHGVELLHAWGMAETSSLVTTALPPRGVDAEQEWAHRVSQGQFPVSVRFRVVGPDGAVVPNDGVSTGELQLRGPCVTAAYHGGVDAPPHRPAEHFTADGWLRTGDIGNVSPDGFLTLTDRAKDVIKSGGEFISSVALENALTEHPAVVEAAVVAVSDDHWGERPLAAVSLRAGSRVDFEDLRDFLRLHLASWMVPERWAVVGRVPKTSVGKHDKRRIRDEYARGLLDVVHLGGRPGGGAAAGQAGPAGG
ncbi:fatty-acyl-CoA synthase [Saccharothrix tamanrassetensis]|uniref:Fatty-acyl-CoA synthase n=1 Tax=Saccharothrix tamanrassetensis TaxID=1051531 RepID=A0A841C945_9PSEU|nr:long-chain-fatty-acid--CoA ligase [Saccharothrix tamanrassetensis]MBB5953939.1 fatty-acyl-CoA synthase [Saccharothrix tamanrassetensis]